MASALLKEVKEMDQELSSALAIAATASLKVEDERQRRVRAETALERYTRITALQRAATEALQFGISSPGRGGQLEGEQGAEEAMQRLAAEIRASGLAAATPRDGSPRTHSLTGTPRTEHGTPSKTPGATGSSAPTTRADPALFVRTSSLGGGPDVLGLP